MVWQASSTFVQLLRHDALALALLVVVAAPVGGVPGTTQDAWQVAACELQVIMHVVVVEVCASRIPLSLAPAGAAVDSAAAAKTIKSISKRRTPTSVSSHS